MTATRKLTTERLRKADPGPFSQTLRSHKGTIHTGLGRIPERLGSGLCRLAVFRPVPSWLLFPQQVLPSASGTDPKFETATKSKTSLHCENAGLRSCRLQPSEFPIGPHLLIFSQFPKTAGSAPPIRQVTEFGKHTTFLNYMCLPPPRWETHI